MVAVYANQLIAQLTPALAGSAAVVVLLWGDDAGALRQATQQVVALSGIDPTDPFSAESFSLADLAADPARLPDSAGIMPLLAGRRLLRLVGVSGEERADSLSSLTQAMAAVLTMPLPPVLIILPLPRLLDKNHALVKLLEKPHATVTCLAVRFYEDKARDLHGWLQTEARSAGKTFAPDALALMVGALGADREIAKRELEKLFLYCGENATVTADDVATSVVGAMPTGVFRLTDAIGNRQPAEVDRLIQQFLEEGEDLNGAFTQVVRHLEMLNLARQALQAGQPETEVLQKTGKVRAPREVQQAFLSQARGYPARRLATLSAYAFETLQAARSGHLPADHVIARALLALST